MAVAVIGGLITSTVLSLVLVPVVYEFVDDLERWLAPRLGRLVAATQAIAHQAENLRAALRIVTGAVRAIRIPAKTCDGHRLGDSRLLLPFARELIDREDLEMLQENFRIILASGRSVLGDEDNVDEITRQDEARYAAHVIDPQRHGALALVQQRAQQGALAGSGNSRTQDRLAPLQGREHDTTAVLE